MEENKTMIEKIVKASEQMNQETPERNEESVDPITRISEQADAFRSKLEDAQAKVVELESKLAVFTSEGELSPHELKSKLDKVLFEHADLLEKQPELHQMIKHLRLENEQYKRQVSLARIKESLFTEAKRLGIRSEAMRDVERLASEFSIDESGQIVTSNGRSVRAILEAEKALSPHWLPASQGGGSFPGGVETESRDLFNMARHQHDLQSMIANAPLVE